MSQLGDSLADSLVGYITIGVNRSATSVETNGGRSNIVGARAAAYALDASEGYFVECDCYS